ncbi:MAG TPA: hypothetical protein VGQ20_04200 [Acidimicrobiales bacterium]|nr:hypothetical protein [Acidimicrobiales bacterium]
MTNGPRGDDRDEADMNTADVTNGPRGDDRDGTRVLVADDDDGYADALAHGLSLGGEVHVIGRAATAGEVVAATAALGPAAVVLDARMPGGSVDQTIDCILAASPSTAVVVVSGLLGPRLRGRLAARGIVAVDKADGLAAITTALRAAVDRG